MSSPTDADDRIEAASVFSRLKAVKVLDCGTSSSMTRATLGFSSHSGWSALVAVGGSAAAPEVLVRARIEMADASLEGSRQPYHALEGLPLVEAARCLRRFERTAHSMAHAGVQSILDDLRGRGHEVVVAGILDASGRKAGSLGAILASHALIHMADGDHFREALAEASGRCGLAVTRIRGRDLLGRAATALRRPDRELLARAKELGRPLGPPWTADHKSAALLAWLLLASR
jgi:hypothetical protein